MHLPVTPLSTTSPNDYVADHVRAIPRSGIRDFFEIVQSMKGVISLGIGEPDFVTPWHIREAAIYALERGKTGYTSNLGLMTLREEISRYVASDYKLQYDPATEILIAVGVSEALDLALRAVLNPGDEVLYHEPCYVSYSPSIALAHGVAVPIGTHEKDEFKLTPAALKAALTPKSKVLLMNFPCNPTGGVMTAAELAEIAEICIEHNLLVITDEIYSELFYATGGHTSIASLPGMRERTIFLHGFSKAFAMTGFRIGYACAPAPLIDAMMRIHQYGILCAPIVSQEAAIEALRHGRGDMEEMREQYRLRRNFLVHAFRNMGLPCFEPRGAFYLFPSIKSTGKSSHDFAFGLLKAEQVAVVPGTAFGPSGEGHVRCSYATGMEQLKIAAERIARFVGKK
jgi:aminotransferase